MVFWITSRMKAKKEQVNDKLMVIKLFGSNYARDLIIVITYVTMIGQDILNLQICYTE